MLLLTRRNSWLSDCGRIPWIKLKPLFGEIRVYPEKLEEQEKRWIASSFYEQFPRNFLRNIWFVWTRNLIKKLNEEENIQKNIVKVQKYQENKILPLLWVRSKLTLFWGRPMLAWKGYSAGMALILEVDILDPLLSNTPAEGDSSAQLSTRFPWLPLWSWNKKLQSISISISISMMSSGVSVSVLPEVVCHDKMKLRKNDQLYSSKFRSSVHLILIWVAKVNLLRVLNESEMQFWKYGSKTLVHLVTILVIGCLSWGICWGFAVGKWKISVFCWSWILNHFPSLVSIISTTLEVHWELSHTDWVDNEQFSCCCFFLSSNSRAFYCSLI